MTTECYPVRASEREWAFERPPSLAPLPLRSFERPPSLAPLPLPRPHALP
jgi:hypothetical protein